MIEFEEVRFSQGALVRDTEPCTDCWLLRAARGRNVTNGIAQELSCCLSDVDQAQPIGFSRKRTSP